MVLVCSVVSDVNFGQCIMLWANTKNRNSMPPYHQVWPVWQWVSDGLGKNTLVGLHRPLCASWRHPHGCYTGTGNSSELSPDLIFSMLLILLINFSAWPWIPFFQLIIADSTDYCCIILVPMNFTMYSSGDFQLGFFLCHEFYWAAWLVNVCINPF